MTKEQAQMKGYKFYGVYSDDKESVKLRALELRKQGHKAITVTIPPTGYERGGGLTGYSVYWIENEKA
jgi:5-deoxy-D-glucuronate isomerase